MSGDLFGSCINGNPCPKTCLPPGYKDATYPQFGNTFPAFTTNSLTNNSTNSQKTVYGGLLNSRRIKQYASMHILAKGSFLFPKVIVQMSILMHFLDFDAFSKFHYMF